MHLSDIVGTMNMTIFPIIGLIIFLGVFLAVVLRAVLQPSDEGRTAAAIPLEDEATPSNSTRTHGSGEPCHRTRR